VRARYGPSQPRAEGVAGFGGLHHQVILALGAIGAPALDAIPLLEGEYEDPTNPLRFEAAAARVQIDGDFAEVMPVLAAGLEEAEPGERAMLAARLGGWAGSYDGAVTLLSKALGDGDAKVRMSALRGVARLGDKAAPALPALLAALDDGEPEIRIQALNNLRLLGSKAVLAVPGLIKALGDAEMAVRLEAIASLAALEDRAAPALPALRGMAGDPKFTVRIMASNAVNTIALATDASPGGSARAGR
jgi:HEAT repeat protein